MNMYSVDDFFYAIDKGYGFDAGLATKYPLTNRLSLNSEVSFCYRVLGGFKDKEYNVPSYIEDDDGELIFVGYYNYDIKVSLSEMAILVPIMVQFTVIENAPFYVSAGMQLGFPFNNKYKNSYNKYTLEGEILEEISHTESDDGSRSFVDFGIALGIGCMIMPNLGVDLRFISNLNRVFDGHDFSKTSLMYFTFGVSYFL